MKHFGDITKINGFDVPNVDIVVGGSPCQDLSVAGLRKGLAGERSGLFMEQIRIIKEMREKEKQNGKAIDDIRPRYMVWENVIGAFSSNGGEDFRCVLEETAKIADENAIIPGLAKGQKWTPSGCIMADGWSIAWRVHNARFWGVPQRRNRIALVADFGGSCAPEILFERKSMSRDIAQGKAKGQDSAGAIEECINGAKCYGISPFDSNAMKSSNPNSGIYEADTIKTLDMHGGNPNCKQGGMAIVETYDVRISREGTKNWRAHCYKTDESRSLDSQGENPDTNHGGVAVVYTMDRAAYNQGINTKYDFAVKNDETMTLVARGPHLVSKCASDYKEINKRETVRRLTPLECERLQGFPDNWTDIGDWIDTKGKKHKGDSDTPRYKALGNSIALPFWEWMAKRMCATLNEPTMASLFDGIGGFPLVFSRAGCEPIWASEIEEFPIAVTKKWFGEE